MIRRAIQALNRWSHAHISAFSATKFIVSCVAALIFGPLMMLVWNFGLSETIHMFAVPMVRGIVFASWMFAILSAMIIWFIWNRCTMQMALGESKVKQFLIASVLTVFALGIANWLGQFFAMSFGSGFLMSAETLWAWKDLVYIPWKSHIIFSTPNGASSGVSSWIFDFDVFLLISIWRLWV